MTEEGLSGSRAREQEINSFLQEAGWADGQRAFLTGDASNRRYETVRRGRGETLLLMDAPPDPLDTPISQGETYSDIAHLATDCRPFIAIGQHLRAEGIRSPQIHAFDLERGLILLENFGDTGFTPLLKDQDPAGDFAAELYLAATDLLVKHHRHAAPQTLGVDEALSYALPAYDDRAMMVEVSLLLDWYVKEVQGEKAVGKERPAFEKIWQDMLAQLDRSWEVLVMRDYHSPNLHWFAGEEGTNRIGVIDFQDGLRGPRAYDLASLLQDARRDVPAHLERQLLEHYVATLPDTERDSFMRDYAIIAAQRVTKILGIFIRLWRRDGKTNYLQHIPRLWGYLERSLQHPVLSEYKRWLDTSIPVSDRRVERAP